MVNLDLQQADADNPMGKSALLVIDMLNDFFDQHTALATRRTQLVVDINALCQSFRDRELPVIWVRQEFRPDLSDGFLEMRRRGIATTIAGTPGSQILSDLEIGESDHTIIKKRYSSFFETSLDELLAQLKTRTLVVAGINTHACVRTTVIDAYQRDYDVVVVSDCIASYDPEHHDVTVRYLSGKMARFLRHDKILE